MSQHTAAEESQEQGIKNSFLDDIGVEFLSMANGQSEIALTPLQRHMNTWQVVHGGVIMTLLDVAMAMAGRSLTLEPDGGNMTIEMKTTFVQPTTVQALGSKIIARGNCFHLSTTMAFCEGELLDDLGRICAKSTGTFKFFKRLKPGRKIIRDG